MFKERSNQTELMDDLSLNNEEFRQNLDELEMLNQWVGSKQVLISALNKVFKKYEKCINNSKLTIADLGCGGGDLLRAISDWAKSKKVIVELIGFDANAFVIQYAEEKSRNYPNIQYKTMDILSSEFAELKFDIITINSFCHHLENATLVSLIAQLNQQAKFAVIINDLQRSVISYFVIKHITRLLSFSVLSQTDGPISVSRAFHKKDLINLLAQAQISFYQIRWAWIFRWEVIIWSMTYEN